MTRLHYNGFRATLGVALSPGTTVITFTAPLTHSNGVPVPTLTGSDTIRLALLDSAGDLKELVDLTDYTEGALTGPIDRSAEDTSAVSHTAGAPIRLPVTDADIAELADAVAAQLDAESIRDLIGATLSGGDNVTITVDDAGNVVIIGAGVGEGDNDAEFIRDTAAAMLVAGPGITKTTDDPGNTVTLSVDTTAATLLEAIRDAIGTALVEAGAIDLTVDDAGNTITINLDTAQVAELIRDTMNTATVAGTGLVVTPNDGADSLTFGIDTTAEAERIRDVYNTSLVAGPGIKIAKDDAGDTTTISAREGLNAQTGTTYTFDIDDRDKWVSFNNAAAVTVTVPPNSAVAYAVGDTIEGHQQGAGQVTFVEGAGVTIVSAAGKKIAAQYGVFGLRKLGTNSWLLYGRTAT